MDDLRPKEELNETSSAVRRFLALLERNLMKEEMDLAVERVRRGARRKRLIRDLGERRN